MISTNFVVVDDIYFYSSSDGKEEYVVDFDFDHIMPIMFSGNRVIKMEMPISKAFINESDCYGKILVAYEDDELKTFYLILKNRTIFSLDTWDIKEIKKALDYYSIIKEFESLKVIRAFVNL